MTGDSKDEKKDRAKALREQISDLVERQPAPASHDGDESPADFIRRRMAELEQKKDKP